MAGRIRSIKPEVLEDAVATALSDAAWRLWISLWVLADDHGNARADDRYLAAMVWQDTGKEAGRPLEELIAVALIEPYAVRGQRYVHVAGWSKHQRVDNAGKPRVPPPTADDGTWNQEVASVFSAGVGDNSRASEDGGDSRSRSRARIPAARPPTTDHRPPTPDVAEFSATRGEPQSEERVRVADGEASPAAARSRTRAKTTRITPDWKPSEATVESFLRQGVDAMACVAEFVDYWLGEGKGKADWEATFRNRVRALIGQGRAPRIEPESSYVESTATGLVRRVLRAGKLVRSEPVDEASNG